MLTKPLSGTRTISSAPDTRAAGVVMHLGRVRTSGSLFRLSDGAARIGPSGVDCPIARSTQSGTFHAG
ncbi:hypothetical protein KCP78_01065 [Salmonella enterica subsp. enterica]|nr:hypothetical protein KCP78_01065 [Salmonella enterica subsp. enterica]